MDVCIPFIQVGREVRLFTSKTRRSALYLDLTFVFIHMIEWRLTSLANVMVWTFQWLIYYPDCHVTLIYIYTIRTSFSKVCCIHKNCFNRIMKKNDNCNYMSSTFGMRDLLTNMMFLFLNSLVTFVCTFISFDALTVV